MNLDRLDELLDILDDAPILAEEYEVLVDAINDYARKRRYNKEYEAQLDEEVARALFIIRRDKREAAR